MNVINSLMTPAGAIFAGVVSTAFLVGCVIKQRFAKQKDPMDEAMRDAFTTMNQSLAEGKSLGELAAELRGQITDEEAALAQAAVDTAIAEFHATHPEFFDAPVGVPEDEDSAAGVLLYDEAPPVPALASEAAAPAAVAANEAPAEQAPAPVAAAQVALRRKARAVKAPAVETRAARARAVARPMFLRSRCRGECVTQNRNL